MEDRTPLLADSIAIPYPCFCLAKKDADRRRTPQAIAHRGYKAAFPENSMAAFEAAVKVGAHAIETDLHMTKDGVIVLSHDADLKRCFGVKGKIVDCDWAYLSTLRTLKEPQQPMPRLIDVLNYLARPGLEHIWILLDIKLDDDADTLMHLIGSTIAQVKPSRPWRERVVLGCWGAMYLPLCTKYLPGFPITHIGVSIQYAREFLKVPNVSFNMLQKTLVGPWGEQFIADCKTLDRALFLWTVNDEQWMKWSIRKEVDGVITDDPKLFLEVCQDYDEKAPLDMVSLREYGSLAWINLLVAVFSPLFRFRYGFYISPEKFRNQTAKTGPGKG